MHFLDWLHANWLALSTSTYHWTKLFDNEHEGARKQVGRNQPEFGRQFCAFTCWSRWDLLLHFTNDIWNLMAYALGRMLRMAHNFLVAGGLLFLSASFILFSQVERNWWIYSASTSLCNKLAISDLRTPQGTHGISRLYSDTRKMATEWQDGLLALPKVFGIQYSQILDFQ